MTAPDEGQAEQRRSDAVAFAAQVLGVVISTEDPPVGSPLADLARLVKRQEAGELTPDQVRAEMLELHPYLG